MEGTKLGRYLKSVHYADYALGLFFDALDKEGLLDNTAIVFFGDHDARLPKDDFDRLYNYDKATNDVLPSTDPNYKEVNDYTYEIDRKTPLIIWSKSTENKAKKVSYFMGMYDVMPTLGNMMGFSNKYVLGHDIFNIKDNNIIVFPTSNWLTKDMYYNSQKAEGYAISTGIIGDDYIAKNSKYAEELLKVSNDILIYDLIRNSNAEASKINENKIVEGASQ
jgi:phosphoglycerol transferase MdoB-like AlkP superfamily enzyme